MAYSVGEPQGPAGVMIGKQRQPECGITYFLIVHHGLESKNSVLRQGYILIIRNKKADK
jgi:hypothetical protein